jgi:hypothetical protein
MLQALPLNLLRKSGQGRHVLSLIGNGKNWNVPSAGNIIYFDATCCDWRWWSISFETSIAGILTNPRTVLSPICKSSINNSMLACSGPDGVSRVGKTYQGTATALLHEPKVLQAETFPQISI